MNQQTPHNRQEPPLPSWLNKIRALVQNQQNDQEAQQLVPQPGAMSQRTSWAAPPVKFTEAVKICLLQKFTDFSGRASRSEFWFYAAAHHAILLIPVIGAIAYIPLYIPLCAAAVRRLHDTGKSGWWLLSILLGFIYTPMWIFMLINSTKTRSSIFIELAGLISLGIIAMCCYLFSLLIQKGEDKRNRFDNDAPSLPHP